MLTTENCSFKLNRDGTMDIFPGPGFTLPEWIRVLNMAELEAKRKKIKIPTKFNRWW